MPRTLVGTCSAVRSAKVNCRVVVLISTMCPPSWPAHDADNLMTASELVHGCSESLLEQLSFGSGVVERRTVSWGGITEELSVIDGQASSYSSGQRFSWVSVWSM